MTERGKPGQQPNKVDFEDLVRDLQFGTWTITTLEMAYRESINRRTDMPEGAKNLLIGGANVQYKGILRFASVVKGIIHAVDLSYSRGTQEGHEVKNPDDWDGGFKNRAIEK